MLRKLGPEGHGSTTVANWEHQSPRERLQNAGKLCGSAWLDASPEWRVPGQKKPTGPQFDAQ